MASWVEKIRAAAHEVSLGANIIVRVKAAEMRHGAIAANKLAANLFLKEHASMILPAEYTAKLPGYHQLLEDVKELAESAGLKPPQVYVLANAGKSLRGSPKILSHDTLVVPEISFFAFDSRELRSVVGHELGHIANGDFNHVFASLSASRNHLQEYRADAFSAEITRDPDGMIAVLDKIKDANMTDTKRHPSAVERITRLRESGGNSGRTT